MKTFQQFKEDMTSVQDTMKGFANTMVPQMKKFAKSNEVKNMKKDVLNLFLNKGQDLLNQGQKKIKNLEKQVNKRTHLTGNTILVNHRNER